MNILIVANHFAVCSARYAADAFVRLGHTVRHVGPAMGRNIWGMQVPEAYAWTPDGGMHEWLGDWTPDLLLVMDSDPQLLDNAYPLTLHWKGVPVAVFGVDNHVRMYQRDYFDWYFLAHKSVSIQPYTDKTTWLPVGYDPVAFPPSLTPWGERKYDVCIVGVMYLKRWELVNAMRAAGLKVFAGTGLVYEAYRDAYHNSRVALVSSFNGDLPIRLFEGAGMGCAVVADEIPDLVSWRLNAPVAYYDSVEKAVELCRASITLCGDEGARATALWATNHTWDTRAQVIIDWMATR